MAFDPPNPFDTSGDVVSTTTSAPRVRTASELSAQIKAAGGVLTVNANDSNFIVAVNNSLRFSVNRLTDGRYQVTESFNLWILLGVAGIAMLILLSRSR